MALKSISRLDVMAKVTGQAKYAGDLKFDRLLHLAVLMSPHPYARISKIDPSHALEIPGVVGVYTAEAIPGIAGRENERPVLASELVRYAGDGVALVAAETEEVARLALKKIEMDYQVLEPVLEPETALSKQAPALHGQTNLVCHYRVRKGDLEQGFQDADLIMEHTYETHRVQHVAIEPEAAVAVSGLEGVTVWCPCKSPFNVRRVVAETLGISYNRVRLIQSTIGGSFGGKDYDMAVMASRAALAATLTGRPVKIVYTREESIIEGTKRHPYRMRYKAGVKNDGRITAMETEVLGDAGAYLSKSAMVAWRSAVEATGPYRIPNVKTDVRLAYTNTVPTDALRGFGSPQVNFASERFIDELAQKLEIDPLEFRLINGLREGDVSATGQKLASVSLDSCLQAVQTHFKWQNRKKEIENQPYSGSKRRGIGLACLYRGESLGAGGEGIDTAGVTVHVERDGSAIIYSGLSEVGQGGHTMLAGIVTNILGINPQRVSISPVDTSYVPDSGPTVASRGTVTAGNAAAAAAEEIRERLTAVAREMLKTEAGLVFENGQIYPATDPRQNVAFDDVVKSAYDLGLNCYGHGWFSVTDLWWDAEKGQGDAYFSYVYGACAAEVEVDLNTGKVEVVDFLAAHDIGNAINPREVKGQICGGIAMGVGYALMEDLHLQEGVIKNINFDSYLIPTSLDIHNLIPVLVESPSKVGPLGAKGLGEPATSIVAPAILNAISNALGSSIDSLPADLERVMDQILRIEEGRVS